MDPRGKNAELYLNDCPSGSITIKGANDSWHFGEFRPAPTFAQFAPSFGEWSLLMHAQEVHERVDAAALDELRTVEQSIDRLHAKIFFPESGVWQNVSQVNIDGPLIEWKEA